MGEIARMEMDGKVAVVTGGASGIGEATVIMFVRGCPGCDSGYAKRARRGARGRTR